MTDLNNWIFDKENAAIYIELASLIKEMGEKKKEVEWYLTQLGEKYYQANVDAPPAEDTELFTWIKETYATIDTARERIDEIRGIRKCPDCGCQVEAGMNFCGICGRRISDGPVETCADDSESPCSKESFQAVEAEAEAVIEENPAAEAEAVIEESPAAEAEAVIEESPAAEVEAVIGESPAAEAEAVIEETPAAEAEAVIEESPVAETEAANPVDEFVIFEDIEEDDEDRTVLAFGTGLQTDASDEVPFENKMAEEPAGFSNCPRCGSSIENEDVFCSECGLRIPRDISPAVQDQSARIMHEETPEYDEDRTVMASYSNETGKVDPDPAPVRNSYYKREEDDDEDRTVMAFSDSRVMSEAVVEKKKPRLIIQHYCDNCGEKVDDDALFCGNCGNRIRR